MYIIFAWPPVDQPWSCRKLPLGLVNHPWFYGDLWMVDGCLWHWVYHISCDMLWPLTTLTFIIWLLTNSLVCDTAINSIKFARTSYKRSLSPYKILSISVFSQGCWSKFLSPGSLRTQAGGNIDRTIADGSYLEAPSNGPNISADGLKYK